MDQTLYHGNLGARLSMAACFLLIFITQTRGLTFTDPERSYVVYNPPWSPTGQVQAISLQFRTVTGNALLFAHHYLRENETKYSFEVDRFAVVLQIISGKVKATHYFTTIQESVTAGMDVSNDQWHNVSFSITPATGVMSLTVDGQTDSVELNAYKFASASSILSDKFGNNPSATVYLGGR
nr:uncharacterized protein LOC129279776 [Lytechinus pictus]